MDVDSTLITQEVIELLADHAGTRELVTEVTERAMRGEIDFGESLRERVATLAGVPVSAFEDVLERVTLTPGARELVAELQGRGWTVALVSGGFEEIVAPLAASLGITHFRANRLEVVDGLLTGRTTGPVIDRATKEVTLRELAASEGVDMADTVAIGDGANDLKMMAVAAIGVGYNAKPIVREQADVSIEGDLAQVIPLLDRLS